MLCRQDEKRAAELKWLQSPCIVTRFQPTVRGTRDITLVAVLHYPGDVLAALLGLQQELVAAAQQQHGQFASGSIDTQSQL